MSLAITTQALVLFGKKVIHLQFQATLILLLLILSITALLMLLTLDLLALLKLQQVTQLSTKALLFLIF